MNKAISVAFIALLVTLLACAQANSQKPTNAPPPQSETASPSPKYYKSLKVQATQLSDAVLGGDYAKVADLTFPKLVELMGGRTQFMATLEQSMKDTQSEQFQLLSTTVDDPQDIIEVEKRIYAIVPTTMNIKVPEGTLVGRSFMIAVSDDNGENWTFVAAAGDDQGRLKILFPAAADKLRIPKTEKPVLHRERPPG